MDKKALVLSLIKDDLINSKLIYSLNSIGLDADNYTLHASTTIMNLMDIKTAPLRWENIHDEYLDKTRQIMQIDPQESPRLVDALARDIYAFLKRRKTEEERFIEATGF